MVEVITRYRCEICGQEYLTKEFADACQASLIEDCPVEVGQSVLVKLRYEGPEPDEVTDMWIAPGIIARVALGWEEKYGQQAFEEYSSQVGRTNDFHEWVIEVTYEHQIGKDWYSKEIGLQNLVLPKPDGGES